MDIKLVTEKGQHGGSLQVILGKAILPYLKNQPHKSHILQIEELMKDSYEYMFGRESFGQYRIYFQFNNLPYLQE